jgi:hypothetical protein
MAEITGNLCIRRLLAGMLLFLLLCPALSFAGGEARQPGVSTIEKQGDFIILGFDDMTKRVCGIPCGDNAQEGHIGPESGMIHGVRILDDMLALFQILTGKWLLWDLGKNRFIAELPSLPVVGGLKSFFRIDENRAAFTYYRRGSPLTVVDLKGGDLREISAPAKRWDVEQLRGPLFLGLAEGKLSLFDIDSGPKAAAPIACERFVQAGGDRVVTVQPAGDGRAALSLIRASDMSVIQSREADLDISDSDAGFPMGCNESGDILYIPAEGGVVFFALPCLERIRRIPNRSFAFTGKNGVIAYDRHAEKPLKDRKERLFCIRSLYADEPRFCLSYRSNRLGQFGRFHTGPGFIWADTGKRLRVWDLDSGRLCLDLDLPGCGQSPNTEGGGAAPRLQYAGPRDLAVAGKNRAWAACTGKEAVKLYRMDGNGAAQVFSKKVPSGFAVFICPQKRRLVHVDTAGKIQTWPY